MTILKLFFVMTFDTAYESDTDIATSVHGVFESIELAKQAAEKVVSAPINWNDANLVDMYLVEANHWDSPLGIIHPVGGFPLLVYQIDIQGFVLNEFDGLAVSEDDHVPLDIDERIYGAAVFDA